MKRIKLFFVLLVLVVVFLLSYLIAFFVISLTPYGYTQRVYSKPLTLGSNDPSDLGGEWENQHLSPMPRAGSINVPRDTAIWFEQTRLVNVENLSLSPEVPLFTRTDEYGSYGSATVTFYPAELLEPDTTYNVSAIVFRSSELSWWIFTTSSEPSQLKFNYFSWIAFVAAFVTTLIVGIVCRFLWKKSLLERLRVYRQRQMFGVVLTLIGLSILALNLISNINAIISTIAIMIAVFSAIGSVYYERECMALKMSIETNTQTYAMQ